MASTPQLESVDSTQMTLPRRKHTREEMLALFRSFREEVQAYNPENRDILADFLAERRAEAERE